MNTTSRPGTVPAFLTGVAVGGGPVWYVLEARYEETPEQDIYSVKQAPRVREERLQGETDNLKERLENPDMDTEEPKTIRVSAAKNRERGDINDYVKMINRVQYSRIPVPQPPEHEVEAPYVVSPDEFGKIEGCTRISLTYFDDGILSNEDGAIIDELGDTADNALNRFGEYEEDSVFVRSDPKRCDYEILRDLHGYVEFHSTLPPEI